MGPWLVFFPVFFLALMALFLVRFRQQGLLLPKGVRNRLRPQMLIAVAVALAGAGFLARGAWNYHWGTQSVGWPAVSGTVTASEVVWHPSGNKGSVSYYDNRIEYRYAVGGAEFAGDRVRFGGNRPGYDGARRLVARYAVGKTMSVYCDPSMPARATLLRGPLYSCRTEAVVGAVLAAVGLFFLFIAFKYRFPSSDTPSA